MQRESAIADDFWRNIFRHPKKNRIDAILENIERKYRNELLFFFAEFIYIYILELIILKIVIYIDRSVKKVIFKLYLN